jgi:hypothetical protein
MSSRQVNKERWKKRSCLSPTLWSAAGFSGSRPMKRGELVEQLSRLHRMVLRSRSNVGWILLRPSFQNLPEVTKIIAVVNIKFRTETEDFCGQKTSGWFTLPTFPLLFRNQPATFKTTHLLYMATTDNHPPHTSIYSQGLSSGVVSMTGRVQMAELRAIPRKWFTFTCTYDTSIDKTHGNDLGCELPSRLVNDDITLRE